MKAETIDNFPSSFPPSSALAKEGQGEKRKKHEAKVGKKNKHAIKSRPQAFPVFSEETNN